MKSTIFSALFLAALVLTPSATLSGARFGHLVVIDAGHGGHDSGAVGYAGTLEKDLVLQVAQMVRLKSFATPGLTVVLTRRNDTYVELTGRTDIANGQGADLYVSIHANAHNDPRAVGVETWISDQLSGERRQQSLKLAEALQAAMVRTLQPKQNRGVKAQQLYLRHAQMPSALVELGFLTNPQEEQTLNRLTYQARAADAILQGVLSYFNQR